MRGKPPASIETPGRVEYITSHELADLRNQLVWQAIDLHLELTGVTLRVPWSWGLPAWVPEAERASRLNGLSALTLEVAGLRANVTTWSVGSIWVTPEEVVDGARRASRA